MRQLPTWGSSLFWAWVVVVGRGMLPVSHLFYSKETLSDVDLFCVTEWVFDVFQAGANMIVSGSAIMKSADPRSVINLLRNVCSEAAQKRCLDR